MTVRPRCSALYMPASNPRAIEKARSLPVDVVILDLEDAVAPDAKVDARERAIQAVAQGGFGNRELVIRINGLDTPWGEADLAAVADVPIDAVLLPKVAAPDMLARTRAVLGADGPDLWAMIETARAIVDLRAIVEVAATHRLTTLVAGTNDLAKELRCRPEHDRAPLHASLAAIVLHARMAGLDALDGVCNVLDDAAAIENECHQGLRWGFDGKTLIHPAQVAIANRIFSPSAAEVEWASTVVAAFDKPDNAGKGALKIDGKMVELLHLDEAHRTLMLASACVPEP